MLQYVAVCCSVLHCVAVCCSVLQCVAVCCSVFAHEAIRNGASERHAQCSRYICICCTQMTIQLFREFFSEIHTLTHSLTYTHYTHAHTHTHISPVAIRNGASDRHAQGSRLPAPTPCRHRHGRSESLGGKKYQFYNRFI